MCKSMKFNKLKDSILLYILVDLFKQMEFSLYETKNVQKFLCKKIVVQGNVESETFWVQTNFFSKDFA